jgi:hypothetical protein
MVDNLPSICKALGSIPVLQKTRDKNFSPYFIIASFWSQDSISLF